MVLKGVEPPIQDGLLEAQIVLLPGKDHYDLSLNRQDQLMLHWIANNGQLEAAVIACDGCSSSITSEAGAAELAEYATPTLAALVQQYGLRQKDQILSRLYGYILGEIRHRIERYPLGGQEYLALLDLENSGGIPFILDDHPNLKPVYYMIDRNYMVTMVGLYFGVEGVLAFQRGDGGYIVDDNIHVENYSDFPPYIAYSLIPRQKLEQNLLATNNERLLAGKTALPPLPSPAFTGRVFPGAQKAAIFSDGLTTATGIMTDVLNEEIWNRLDSPHLWDFRKNRLRNWVRASWKDGKLTDDISLAAFLRRNPTMKLF